MCFSAEASYTTAVLIGAVGCATIAQKKPRNLYMLSLIPLFFALQQLSEGFLWTLLGHRGLQENGLVTAIALTLYLIFAFIIWPIWVPLSIFAAEEKGARRKVIGACLVGGFLLVAYTFTQLTGNTVGASVFEGHMGYSLKSPFSLAAPIFSVIYLSVILIPCFVSSVRLLWVFGALVGVSWVLATLVYLHAFTSVWCFFAAIISSVLFFVIKKNK